MNSRTHFDGTPFHESTSQHVVSCLWYGWSDYVLPDVYTSAHDELKAVRERAGIIDMSPLPKMTFRGPDAGKLLDKLMTRPVLSVGVGRALFSPWCNEEGLMIGDGLIFRLQEEEYIVVGENSQSWFESHIGDLNVSITDQTKDYGVLSLQGPRSNEIMAKSVDGDWQEIEFSELAKHKIAGVDVFIARQGFTGEKGYEIWTPVKGGAEVWQAVYDAGQEFGSLPTGEYAVDLARLEAGLILVSADYAGAGTDEKTANVAVDTNLVITPIEAGLARLVDFEGDRDFIGKKALKALRDSDHGNLRFVGLKLDAEEVFRAAIRYGRPDEVLSRVYWGSTGVFQNNVAIGRASSLAWSPTVGAPIGFGFLDTSNVSVGDLVDVDLRSTDGSLVGRVGATVVDTPFVELRRSK